MRRFVAPIVIIIVGILWLLNALKVSPGIDWLWTGGLAAAGALVLLLGGRTRRSFVVGLLLVITAFTSALRQKNWLPGEAELPILIIALGVLMIASQFILKRESGSDTAA